MKTPAIMNKVLGALDAHCIPVANYTESIVRLPFLFHLSQNRN